MYIHIYIYIYIYIYIRGLHLTTRGLNYEPPPCVPREMSDNDALVATAGTPSRQSVTD